MDRLTSMQVFVKAVDLGSFAAAAQALDLSAPMVGKHVQWLEARLAVRLINRTTRRQSVTAFGRAYYERCRLILAEADAADALAAEQLGEPRGRLRITMPVHFGRYCAMPVLMRFARRYPGIELDLSMNDRFVDLADDGYDLAIRTGALEDSADLVARRVARQRMTVCASPAWLAAHGRPETLDDLAQHEAIVYRRSGRVPPWRVTGEVEGEPAVEITPPNRIRLDDLAAIADAVAAGEGPGWLPFWLVREQVREGALVELLPAQRGFLYDAYAIWLRTPHVPMRVRLAVEELARALPEMME